MQIKPSAKPTATRSDNDVQELIRRRRKRNVLDATLEARGTRLRLATRSDERRRDRNREQVADEDAIVKEGDGSPALGRRKPLTQQRVCSGPAEALARAEQDAHKNYQQRERGRGRRRCEQGERRAEKAPTIMTRRPPKRSVA